MTKNNFIIPDWPAPANVHALQTTRIGGYSAAPYDSLNLGDHVGDNPITVERNRMLLNEMVPSEPIWLEQVHGTDVVIADVASCRPRADACVARQDNAVCAIMTADCLPVLFCDESGSCVAAAHAGWRGLAGGVLDATVKAMDIPAKHLMVWLGPAIGPQAFEVGEDVRSAFMQQDSATAVAFTHQAFSEAKYLADIYQLARLRLQALGVMRIYGGGLCTYTDSGRFFSYRRDGRTGRMATLIWKA